MNCVKDDLVRYVGNDLENYPNVRGWIGRTIKFEPSRLGENAWRVSPPIGPDWIDKDGVLRRGNWIFDIALRPIRYPGDDAVDETLIWKQVPKEIA
jgi:hypothetical protein